MNLPKINLKEINQICTHTNIHYIIIFFKLAKLICGSKSQTSGYLKDDELETFGILSGVVVTVGAYKHRTFISCSLEMWGFFYM